MLDSTSGSFFTYNRPSHVPRRRRLSLAVIALLLWCGNVHAEQPPCPSAPAAGLEAAKVKEPTGWFDAWKTMKQDMEEKTGTSVSICIDEHYHYIINGFNEGRGRDLFWWTVTLRQKLWNDATLVACARGNSDNGVPPDGIVPLVGSRLNLDSTAYETEYLYLANLFLEQRLLDGKLLLAAGKINFPLLFDTNKIAGWDFFSCSLARNAAFPHRFHTIGAFVRYDPADWLYVQAGIMDAQGIRSEPGLNTAFRGEDSSLSMYELGMRTQIAGREGNYRFDLWYDPQPLNRHDGSGVERDNVGFGVNFDQMLTERGGVFLRYGWNDGDVRTFGNYWSLGGICTGPLPGREKDALVFGFGQGITDDSFRRARNATASESIFELYYKIHITEWCSLTLDAMTVLNPGTRSTNDVAVIPGIRLKLTF